MHSTVLRWCSIYVVVVFVATGSMILRINPVASMGHNTPKIIRTSRAIARGICNRGIWWLDSSSHNNDPRHHPPAAAQKFHLSTAPTLQEDQQRPIYPWTRTDIRKMKVAHLREELISRGLDAAGRKADLVQRLQALLDRSAIIHKDDPVIPPEIDLPPPPEDHDTMLDPADSILGEYVFSDDLRMTHHDTIDKSSPSLSTITDQSIYQQQQDVATTDIVQLDPGRRYVIRVRSVPSGKARVVEGIGIGMSLLVESEDNGDLTLLETHQRLLPGKESLFEADYCALIMAVREAKKRGVEHLVVEMDDVGIVRQLTGQGRVGDGYKEELYHKVLELKNDFQNFEVRTHLGPDECEETKVLAKTALAKQNPMDPDNWAAADEPLFSENVDTPSISIDPKKEYIMRFDGGARGNSLGVAGAGMVIYDGDREVWCGWKYLGSDGITNNIAEYSALIEGLRSAQYLGVRRICAEGDSELVVKQIMGIYKVKKEWLRPLHKEAKKLLAGFDEYKLTAIRRANNSRADFLANHAMDVQDSYGLDDIV